MLTIESVELLLLVAAVVAMVARRLRLPYSVGLVLGGLVLAWVPFAPDIALTRELIFNAFLPPLIFEAAIYIAWPTLRKDLPVVLTLATVGVVLSAGITTAGMHVLAHWSWPASLLFGVLISATDPVSVIATFKEAGVHGRLRELVEAESLLNDSTAAVGFGIAIAFATGAAITPLGTAQFLAVTIVGGVACGAAVAAALLALAGRTEDPLVEITFTTIAAYGSFLLAEHLEVSGVLATLTAGIMLGNLGPLGAISPRGREAVQSFWDYAAFVVNSLDLPADGDAGGAPELHPGVAADRDRHRPGDRGAGPVHLSLLQPVPGLTPAGEGQPPARALLGRPARRPGPGPGAGPAHQPPLPRRRRDGGLRRGGFFSDRAGAVDHTADALPRRDRTGQRRRRRGHRPGPQPLRVSRQQPQQVCVPRHKRIS
jgi:hypothetical protein